MNTYCFFTATIVTSKRINVAVVRTLPTLFKCYLYYEFPLDDPDSRIIGITPTTERGATVLQSMNDQ